MEVLLPVALKVFPNMLPSTFEDKLKVSITPCKHTVLNNTLLAQLSRLAASRAFGSALSA